MLRSNKTGSSYFCFCWWTKKRIVLILIYYNCFFAPFPKFQTAFAPPPHFRKIILQISRQNCVCSLWRDCCELCDPISHEMHVVQQFNMVIGWKHTLKRPFCIIFMPKKPYLKVQILQYEFLYWKCPPPPFGNFPKIHPFWWGHPSLRVLIYHNMICIHFVQCWRIIFYFHAMCCESSFTSCIMFSLLTFTFDHLFISCLLLCVCFHLLLTL